MSGFVKFALRFAPYYASCCEPQLAYLQNKPKEAQRKTLSRLAKRPIGPSRKAMLTSVNLNLSQTADWVVF